jgi:hypothetical protein
MPGKSYDPCEEDFKLDPNDPVVRLDRKQKSKLYYKFKKVTEDLKRSLIRKGDREDSAT